MNSEATNPEQVASWWERLANAYASRVWAVIQEAQLPDLVAIDVNRLAWMRLADNIGAIRPQDIESWLCQTARREATRSARLMGLNPPLTTI
jgi:hypothetical protein